MDRQAHSDRLDAAARWYADLQGADAGAPIWDAFRAWEQDPLNAAAFRDIEAALATLDRSSLARKVAAPVRRPGRAGAWLGALAAALALAGLAGLVLLDRAPAGAPAAQVLAYETATGEYRQVRLEDGSAVDLNTASRIEVAYSGGERRIRLIRGQALFSVRPGEAPFIVEASGTRTRALGTEFDVYLRPGGAEITLLEGVVSVMATGAAGQGVLLSPGEQLRVRGGVAGPVREVDVASAMSWRTGILQFTDVTLAEAAAELNRYSETRIVILDPDLAQERLSGAFRAGDQEQFVSALAMFLPVEITRTGSEIQVRPSGG